MSGSGAIQSVATILFCLLLATGFVSSPDAAPFNLHPADPDTSDAIASDPEFDLDRDGLLNRDGPDDDNDGVPDADDPAPHDPKTWLDPDFLAPSDPQQREELWGPVIGTWTSPGGGQCYEFQSGAKLCDYPGGSIFVWIVKDYTAWLQDSNGSRESRLQSGDVPDKQSSGSASTSGDNQGIPAADAPLIAEHAIGRGHEIPGFDLNSPAASRTYEEYVLRASMKQNVQEESQPANFAGPAVRKKDGARAWYDFARNTIIIHNPVAEKKGTVYSGEDALKDSVNFPSSDTFDFEK